MAKRGLCWACFAFFVTSRRPFVLWSCASPAATWHVTRSCRGVAATAAVACRPRSLVLGPWLSSWQQGPKNDECANVTGLLPHPRSWPWPLLHSAELPWLLCCSRWKSFAAATKFQSILGLLDNIWCNMSRIRDYIWFGGANSSCNSASPSRQKFVQV